MPIHKFGFVREKQGRDWSRDKHRDEVTYRQHRNIETHTEMDWLRDKHRDRLTLIQTQRQTDFETNTATDWLTNTETDWLRDKDRDEVTSRRHRSIETNTEMDQLRDKHRDRVTETNTDTYWLRDKHRDRLTSRQTQRQIDLETNIGTDWLAKWCSISHTALCPTLARTYSFIHITHALWWIHWREEKKKGSTQNAFFPYIYRPSPPPKSSPPPTDPQVHTR